MSQLRPHSRHWAGNVLPVTELEGTCWCWLGSIPTSLMPSASPGAGEVRWRKLLHFLYPNSAWLCSFPPRLTLSHLDFIPLGIHYFHLLRPRQTIPSFTQRCSALASATEGGMETVYCGLRPGLDVSLCSWLRKQVSLSSCFLWASKLPG